MTTNRVRSSSSPIDLTSAFSQERTKSAKDSLKSKPSPNVPFRSFPSLDVHIRQRLSDLTKDVNLADAHDLLQVRENVVREVLLWEFGDDFRFDSQFSPMVDAISKAMDAAPAFQQRFIDLIIDLRKP